MQSDNCTALASLDFKEVVKRFNIGSEDFWGIASNAWLVLFYAHYIALIILFIIVVCWCVLILLNLWKFRRSRMNYLYVVLVYCTLWSIISALQYILLAVDVSLMPSQDLAVVTYCLEMVAFATSMNGLLIYAVDQYCQLRALFTPSHHFPRLPSLMKYLLLFTGPSLAIAVTIVIIILTFEGSGLAIIAMLVLIVLLAFIGMLGTTLLVTTYIKLWYRNHMKIFIRKLIIRLTSYVYLVMVCGHLLTPFIQLTTKDNCIEEAQGNRTVWLSVQTVVKLFEVFLVIQCLTIPQKVKLLFRNCWPLSQSSKPSQLTQCTVVDSYFENRSHKTLPNHHSKKLETKHSNDHDVDNFCNLQEERVNHEVSTGHNLGEALEVALHHSDVAATGSPSSCQLNECVNNKSFNTVVEREILSQTSSNNVGGMFKVQSDEVAPPGKLEHEFQGDQQLNCSFDELQLNRDLCILPHVHTSQGE